MNKFHHRILSVFLAAVIAGSSCCPSAYADAAGSALPVLQEATETQAGTSSGGCNHLCGEECVRMELTCTLEETEGHTHTESCYTAIADCTHVHDADCGYLSPAEPPADSPEPDPGEESAEEPVPDGETEPDGDSLEEMESSPAESDPDPELLNLEMLVQQEGFASLESAMLLTQGLSGSTILLGEDNEDNARSGESDCDMDLYVSMKDSQHPIEVRLDIPAEQLPRENAYLAIKAHDVDEEYGETDNVYWNGVLIGQLSGTDRTWNTTVLEVPVDLIQSGSNYIEITVSRGWIVKIDWFQLLLDGGEKPESLQSFDLELGTPIAFGGQEGTSGGLILPVYLQIRTSDDQPHEYKTEYSLMDQSGNSLAAAFGSPSGSGSLTDQALLPLPDDLPTGVYQVSGLLKDPDSEQILARDQVSWYYAGPDSAGEKYPEIRYGTSPSGKAARSVTFSAEAIMLEGMTAESITITGLTGTPVTGTDRAEAVLDENFSDRAVEITVSYTLDGEPQTVTIPVKASVLNIDRVPPEMTVSSEILKISGDASEEEIRTQVQALVSAADSVSEGGSESYAGIAEIRCEIDRTGGTASVTAIDYAGNTSNSISVRLLTDLQPLQLGIPAAVRRDGSSIFDLSTELISDGGLAVTETGFVWGVMQNPTLTVNNGRSATPAPAETGGTIAAQAEIADGVTFYARAYLTADGMTYYSQQVSFSLDPRQYGTVTIRNNGDNTFTVSRDGTDGDQTVSYRTVNGSAVGGTHFTHQSGTVTIPDGQQSAVITIEEAGANTPYDGKPATAYSNADRTYQVEIYRVEGGAALGEERFAERTLPTAKTVDRSLFDEYSIPISDRTRGDYEEDKLGWDSGTRIGSAAVETAAVRQEAADYWTHTAQSIRYYLTFEAKENKEGYQVLQMLPGTTLDTSLYPYEGTIKGADSIDSSRVYYAAMFEHGKEKKPLLPYDTWLSYQFPGPVSFPSQSRLTHSLYRSGQSGSYIAFPPDTTSITVGFGGSGSGSDKWNTRNAWHHIQVYDAVEPRLLEIAPMAETTYKPGDPVTLSLVFDEIVDRQNSSLDEVMLETSWGLFRYAGGEDTNVLYFTGTVPEDAAGGITVSRILNAGNIRDLCSPSETATAPDGGSVDTDVDTSLPSIEIRNNGIQDGTASAVVTTENASSQRFAWTRSETLPANGWQDFASGDTLSTRQAAGETWYLHILAEYQATGASAHAYTAFTFPADAVLPALTVSADNDGWARERTIALSYTPADASVTMTGPDGAVHTVTGSQTVTRNGWYSFTLTSGEETLTQSVEVQGIDTGAPVLEELRQPSRTQTPAGSLVFSAVITDALSGVETVEYAFAASAEPPAGGWQTAVPGSNGRCLFDYTARNPEPETVYLHLRAADRAGNILSAVSDAHTVQAPPAGSLTLTLSGAPVSWTSQDADISWRLTGATGDTPYTLYGLPGSAAAETSSLSGSFSVNRNGLYTIMVSDCRGRTAESSVLVNHIDRQGPVASAIEVPGGWSSIPKTVTLQGLTDDITPLYGNTGEVTGYSGSGIASVRYKKLGSDTEIPVTGSSFTVSENGSYTLILTDRAGNQTRQSFTVSGIDTTPPAVHLSAIPGDWQPEVEIVLTPSDQESGLRWVKTCFTAGNTSFPSDGLTEHTGSGPVTVSTTDSSHRYLYYEAADCAGNVTRGFSREIHADGTVPAAPAVTQAGGLENQQGKAVLTVSAGEAGASGLTLWYSLDGDSYLPLSPDTLVLSRPGSCFFKAVTGAGTESPVRSVTLCQVDFAPDGSGELPSHLVLSGGSLAKPQEPSRPGCTFTGWQRDGSAYDFALPVTENFTLTAGWALEQPSVSVSVTYDGSSAEPFAYNGGDLVFAASPAHAAEGISWSFQWYDADGQPVEDAGSRTLTLPAADAGTYQYSCTVTAADPGGLLASASASAAVTIRKQEVPVPAADPSSFTYNRQPQTYVLREDSRYTVSGQTRTEAGQYTVTAALRDKTNFQWDSGSTADLGYEFVIDRAPVTFAVSDTRHDYNGSGQAAQVTPDTSVPGLTLSGSDFSVRYEQDGEAVVPVNKGRYDIVLTLENASLKFAGQDDSLREQQAGTLEILGTAYPGAGSMTWPDAAPLTYGQTLGESALTGGDQAEKGSYAWKNPGDIPLVENGGCTVVFTPADSNYDPVEHTIPVRVSPKELTLAGVTAQSREYDPLSTAVTLSGGSLEGVVIRGGVPDAVELRTDGARGSIAGPDAGENLPVAVSGYALSGPDAVNYTLRQPDYVTADITPAPGTGRVSMAGWTYGDLPARPEAASDTNGTDSMTFRYTGTRADGTAYDSPEQPADAGTYQVQVTFAATRNYQAAAAQAEFEIKPRRITATWNGLDTVYTGLPQAPEIAGLIGVTEADSGKVAASARENSRTDAGTYSGITARLSGEKAHNYLLENNTADFVIRPAPVTFQAEENSVLWDGQPHTARVTARALGQAFDGFTVCYQDMNGQTTEAPSEAGSYTILAQITDPNYRHAGREDGSSRAVGVLTIYQSAPPAVYPVTFLPGADDVTGTVPALPDCLAGTVLFLPEPGDLEREGFRFAGWESGGRIYPTGAAFSMPAGGVTFAAAWTESSGTISGSVIRDDETGPQPAEHVLVTLMQGSRRVAETMTGPDGSFSFTQLPSGAYNLVAVCGEITQTEKILLTDGEAARCTLHLPQGRTNSVLRVLDGVPDIVVGGLDRIFAQPPDAVYTEEDRSLVENGGEVEIRMTVRSSSPAPGSALEEALRNPGHGFQEGLTLNLALDKTRSDSAGTLLGTETVPETSRTLEIVIPLEGPLQNCRNYRVLREHDGRAEELTAAGNQWGEFFSLNEDRTVLTIHARQFSDYTILFSNEVPDHGGSDDDTDSRQPLTPPATEPSQPEPLPEAPSASRVPEPAEQPESPAESAGAPESPAPDQTRPSGPASVPEGAPFVLLSAASAVLAVLLAVLGRNRGRNRPAALLCAAGAAAIALFTSGLNGIVLFTPWTLPAAALALLTGWFARRSEE